LLSLTLVVSPIPFGNVVPALAVALISLAYREADGALLAVAVLASVIALAVATMTVRETAVGAKWIVGLW
jgi:hypothetical protein